MGKVHWGEAVEALVAEYGVLNEVTTSLDTDELLAPSACLGWNNAVPACLKQGFDGTLAPQRPALRSSWAGLTGTGE